MQKLHNILSQTAPWFSYTYNEAKPKSEFSLNFDDSEVLDEGASVQVMELQGSEWMPLASGDLKRGEIQMSFTPATANVKMLFTGPMEVKVSKWCLWKWEMVQEQVLVDICSEDKDPYRFGFNGQMKDNELKGIGNSLDFGLRIYDSRVSRFLSHDSLAKKYPSEGNYTFAVDSPIYLVDKDGKYKVAAQNEEGYKKDYPLIMKYLLTVFLKIYMQ